MAVLRIVQYGPSVSPLSSVITLVIKHPDVLSREQDLKEK